MPEFIHTADTHLGYRQYHRTEREQDFLDAFTQVIDAAIDRGVTAVIHSGDFFHDSRPSTTTIRGALEQLRRLSEHNIEFYAVVGNHENTRDEQWVDIFSELELATHLSESPVIVEDTAFYGIDHVPESKHNQLSLELDPTSAPHSFLVTHSLFAPVSPYGTSDIRHLTKQTPIEFDAILLGDDHTPRIERIDNTLITYAGSSERTATDQTDPRVYNLITTHPSDGVQIEQIELDTRSHIFLDVELAPGEGAETIQRHLDDRDLTDAVVGIAITGDGEEITPTTLEEYGKSLGALVVRVSDRRELAADHLDIDVSFADPDAAVQERISEMDLSVAAYDIEQLVRDPSTVPISNLADQVEDEFSTRIDETPMDFQKTAEAEPPSVSPDEGLTTEAAPTADETTAAEDSAVASPQDRARESTVDDDHADREPPVQVRIEDYRE